MFRDATVEISGTAISTLYSIHRGRQNRRLLVSIVRVRREATAAKLIVPGLRVSMSALQTVHVRRYALVGTYSTDGSIVIWRDDCQSRA